MRSTSASSARSTPQTYELYRTFFDTRPADVIASSSTSKKNSLRKAASANA